MRANIFILLFMTFIVSSCSQKLPISTSNDTGIFIIPISATNKTDRGFSYHYSFIYTPQTEETIKFFPRTEKSFVIIENLPAGEYQIEGIKTSSGRTPGVETGIGGVSRFRTPIPFEIVSNKISLFPLKMEIYQEWAGKDDTWFQGYNLTQMNKDDVKKVINEINSLPNAEFWDFNKKLGVKKKKNEQVNSIRDAAKQGFADAQYNLGLLYEDGRRGVQKNSKKAVEWYKKAANQGYPAAKKRLENLCKKMPELCN